MYILIDGKFLKTEKNPLAEALVNRWGLKENVRVENGRCPFLDRYLARAARSARFLKVGFPPMKKFRQDILRLIHVNRLKNGSVRFFVWQDLPRHSAHSLARIETYYRHFPQALVRRGMMLAVSDRRLDPGDVFHRFKMICHPKPSSDFFEEEYQQAAALKKDEVLFLNTKEHIAECSRSNVFFVSGRKAFTPALACGCFPGVTREILLELLRARKIPCQQGLFPLEQMLNADEVFVTNSSMKVLPVSQIGRARLPTVQRGRVWQMLRDDYMRREHEDGAVQS